MHICGRANKVNIYKFILADMQQIYNEYMESRLKWLATTHSLADVKHK